MEPRNVRNKQAYAAIVEWRFGALGEAEGPSSKKARIRRRQGEHNVLLDQRR